MTKSVIKHFPGQGSNQAPVPGAPGRGSSVGPRPRAAEEFLRQYQQDLLSLRSAEYGIAQSDAGLRQAQPSALHTAVVLHLTPVPGSWPSTPERRLARLLKYALRVAGYRATRLTPVA